MPCEACNIQFTVFKRKKPCMECRRLYCSNCLTRRKEHFLCNRCIIFLTRPISKMELLKLRAKDLIYYLQSKHISTTGCVEKEELVNLVIFHVDSCTGSQSPESPSSNCSDDNRSSPIGNLRNACQNLFTTFTDTIATEFNIIRSPRGSFSPTQSNVHENQSSYNSNRSNSQCTTNSNRPTFLPTESRSTNPYRCEHISSATSATNAKPSVHVQPKRLQNDRTELLRETQNDGCSSSCDCSDDEIITKFRREYSTNSNDASLSVSPHAKDMNSTASSSRSTETGDSSNISSFEDLGANGADVDNWQLVEKPIATSNHTVSPATDETVESKSSNVDVNHSVANKSDQREKSNQTEANQCEATETPCESNEKTKIFGNQKRRILRRRSDGIAYVASSSSVVRNLYIDNDENVSGASTSEEISDSGVRKSCTKCGKTKGDIRKYIERLRKQLQTTTNSSEMEIKEQLEAFLKFLESRSRSSTEANADTLDSPSVESTGDPANGASSQVERTGTNFSDFVIDDFDEFEIDENEGINVYGSDAPSSTTRQFFTLDNIESKDELEELTVKQLKEVLMLNRIDFKGCCEKSELLERVQRLWDDLQKCPSVDKLQPGDLCKICMDAAIECVLLECGHMATCTSCGKVLNECPICRQYIVRVVRFFKA